MDKQILKPISSFDLEGLELIFKFDFLSKLLHRNMGVDKFVGTCKFGAFKVFKNRKALL